MAAIKGMGANGPRGHLRTKSKSKAKRGEKGEQLLQQQHHVSGAALGMAAAAAAGASRASGSKGPLALSALGAATAAAAAMRGSMQAHALLQRVRITMRTDEDDEDGEEDW